MPLDISRGCRQLQIGGDGTGDHSPDPAHVEDIVLDDHERKAERWSLALC